MKKKSQKDVDMVNDWNEKYPEGTPVTVTRDNGETLETVTRSVAWSMCGSAVVMVKGISGCYSLERVRAQQSLHLTLGSLPTSQAVSTPQTLF